MLEFKKTFSVEADIHPYIVEQRKQSGLPGKFVGLFINVVITCTPVILCTADYVLVCVSPVSDLHLYMRTTTARAEFHNQ